MYQVLGDIFGDQQIGSFESEDTVLKHSGQHHGRRRDPSKWKSFSRDQKLRHLERRTAHYKAKLAKLQAKKAAGSTDPRLDRKISHMEAALKTAMATKGGLESDVLRQNLILTGVNGYGAYGEDTPVPAACKDKQAALAMASVPAGNPPVPDVAKMAKAGEELAACMKANAGGMMKKVLMGAVVLALAGGAFYFLKHKKAAAARRKR